MGSKRRIFIEATPLTSSHMSGVGHVLLETLKALDSDIYKERFDIRIFIPWDEKASMSRYIFNNIKIVRLPMPHKVFSLLSRLPIGAPLDVLLGKGDYIFPNFRNWNLLFSRSITYIHDVCFLIYPEYVEERNRKFLTRYIRMWMKRTDKVIAVSNSSKKEIENTLHLDSSRIEVVSNAVDKKVFYKRSQEEVERVKKKYNLKDKYFLYLGNIEPRKNITTLINAFRQTGLQDKAQLFLVGGDGWLNKDVYSAIDEAKGDGYDVIKNQSYVPDEDIPALMSGAVALVQPSWHEGFGLATIQSLACETLNICADIPGLREATMGNEHMVTFFEPSDTEALSSILVKHFNSPSTGTPNEIPTWESSVGKLIDILNERNHDE